MSKDVINDLVEKMGKSSSSFQDANPKDLISAIETSPSAERTNKLSQILRELQSNAQNYKTNNKFRESAHLFYLGGMLSRHFYPQNTKENNAWFQNSVNNLVALSDEYMTWKEIDRGAAAVALANLLNFFTQDIWELEEYYSNFLSNNSTLIQQGKTASGSMWVPHFVVSAINELSTESLQQADQYAQMYLLAEAKTTSLYRDGIMEILNLAREKLSKSVKIPSLQIDALIPKDTLFGDRFSIQFTISKQGEGQIKNAILNFVTPEGITKVSDDSSDRVQLLEKNDQSVVKFEFSSNKDQSIEEKEFQFSGNVQFDDVLGNRRSFLMGPYSIILRTFRKGDQLREQLKNLESDLLVKLKEFESYQFPGVVDEHKATLKDTIQELLSSTGDYISSDDFEKAMANLSTLSSLNVRNLLDEEKKLLSAIKSSDEAITSFKIEINEFLSKNGEIIQDLLSQVDKLKSTIQESK
ncbi:MAG: hypothetical protein HeimC3_26980 [Candidatus Heimdallarchaeota archaeon LC_3]|nr:MAG: hypothetical protein HeimC3_26980 [Candidatus Heimdallarchaeota archaeon LC_3]